MEEARQHGGVGIDLGGEAPRHDVTHRSDEGAAFPSWKEPDRILELVRLAVGTRNGYRPPDLARYGDRIVSFELPSPPVSSTELRERLEAGEPVDELVPAPVARLIEAEGLYRQEPGLH